MEQISGYLVSITYHNEANNYCIAKIKLDDGSEDKIIIVGYFPIYKKDDLVRYTGEFVDHPKYGKQFKVESTEKVLPSDEEAIIRYLSSSYFVGVGRKTAERIVTMLGPNCLEIIKNDPDVLDGIEPKHKKTIIDGLNINNPIEQALSIFVGAGISQKNIMKMEAVYKEDLIDKVLGNPYILIEDIEGIGFNSADKIALSLGIPEDDDRRIEAAIIHALNLLNFETGDTYTSKVNLYERSRRVVPLIDKDSFDYNYKSLVEKNKIIEEEERVYSYDLNNSEKIIGSTLVPFINRNIVLNNNFEGTLEYIEKCEGIKYSEAQTEAIRMALTHGISIITGGPGTGKTTILKAIVKMYKMLNPENKVVLTSPTGKASKRLAEVTGEEACTIHRLLKWDLHSNVFAVNRFNPLVGDLLVIDEFSMVDSLLFSKLMDATINFNQIVIIGDADQLPSVGPGFVLNDLIETGKIEVSHLNKIYRQKESSSIVSLAHHIKDKKIYKEDLDESNDLIFIDRNADEIKDEVIKQIQNELDEGYSLDDIAVLAPIYSGVGGIDHLNDAIQDIYNPADVSKKEYTTSKKIYRVGDKLLQLKNQPEDDVYNGDVGKLIDISGEEAIRKNVLVVDYDGNIVEYGPQDLINLRLAYAISVHKSQGSEYPVVIMPIIHQYRSMLTKNLIYTGISRAKRKLILIGEKKTFVDSVKLRELPKRKTTLKEKIEFALD